MNDPKKILEDAHESPDAERVPSILFANEDAYYQSSNDELCSKGSFEYERDDSGQVVIYTGVFFWQSDGTYRDAPEPISEG